jgi:uncharacterized protein
MEHKLRGPGGTAGGEMSFVLGLLMASAGFYLILNQVQVSMGGIVFLGFLAVSTTASFGMTLVPLILGIGVLFFNARSLIGWGLCAVGVVIIFAGILTNLHMFIRPTTLFNFLVMVTLFAGGLGLMARGLLAGPQRSRP